MKIIKIESILSFPNKSGVTAVIRCLFLLVAAGLLLAQEIQEEKLRYLQEHQLPIPDGSVRGINGSTFILHSYDFTLNGDYELVFLGTCESTNTEWWDRVTVDLGPFWTVVGMDVSAVTPGSLQEIPIMTGIGKTTAVWSVSDYPCSGFGFLNNAPGRNQALFTVTFRPTVYGGNFICASLLSDRR